jgi:hypothetical protein
VFIDVTPAGTNTAAQVSSKSGWTFDQSRNFVDSTAFQDTSLSATPGLQNATGTITGFMDFSDNNIYNVLAASAERRMYIYPDYVNNATTYIAGKFFFSGKFAGSTTTNVSAELDFNAGSSGAGWIHP